MCPSGLSQTFVHLAKKRYLDVRFGSVDCSKRHCGGLGDCACRKFENSYKLLKTIQGSAKAVEVPRGTRLAKR